MLKKNVDKKISLLSYPRRLFCNSDKLSAFAAYTFLTCAALLGGAGNKYPILELTIQLIALSVIILNLKKSINAEMNKTLICSIFIIIGILLIFLIQLIPLPWKLWSSLPFHENSSRILTQIGQTGWRPLSLTWDETVKDAFFLLIPIAAFLVGLNSNQNERIKFIRIFLITGIFSVILGAFQVTGSHSINIFYFFDTGHTGSAVGLFVNRNHQAIFLNTCIVFSGIPKVYVWGKSQTYKWTLWQNLISLAFATIFALGVLTTVSRAGAAFLPVAFLGFGLIQLRAGMPRKWAGILAGFIITVGGFVATTYWSSVVTKRFAAIEESKRFTTWGDTLYAIAETLPLGSGFGSFVPVFQAVESLEAIDPTISNAAHNEFLQYVLEGGIPALFLIIVAVSVIATGSIRLLCRLTGPVHTRSVGVASAISLMILTAHSIVDYPIRMAALATLFGLCAAFLISAQSHSAPGSNEKHHHVDKTRTKMSIFVAAVGITLAIPMILIGLSTHFTILGQPKLALKLWYFNSIAWTTISDEYLISGEQREAELAAIKSLSIAPLQPKPLRNLAIIAKSRTNNERHRSLLQLAGTLGWRDKTTQFQIAELAIKTGDRGVAIQRIDALLRTNFQKAELFGLLRSVLIDEMANLEIAKRLAENPSWRFAFISSLAVDAQADNSSVFRLAKNLRKLKKPMTTQEASPFLSAMVEIGEYRQAGMLWKILNPSQLLGDNNFEAGEGKMTQARTAFSWRANPLFGTNVTISKPAEEWQGNAAIITGSGIAEGVVLEQVFALEPGQYDLSLMQSGETSERSSAQWRVTCLSKHGTSRAQNVQLTWTQTRGNWKHGHGMFIVRKSDCTGSKLALQITPVDASGIKLYVDDVKITKQKDVAFHRNRH